MTRRASQAWRPERAETNSAVALMGALRAILHIRVAIGGWLSPGGRHSRGIVAAQVGQRVLAWLGSLWAPRLQLATTLLILGMGAVLTAQVARQLASLQGR